MFMHTIVYPPKSTLYWKSIIYLWLSCVSACHNCGIVSVSDPCTRCKERKRCATCNRYLPDHCFSNDNGSGICQACTNRSQRTRTALNGLVAAVEIPLDLSNNDSFDSVLSTNGDIINGEVDLHLSEHGYLST